jgi:hypothetical protein
MTMEVLIVSVSMFIVPEIAYLSYVVSRASPYYGSTRLHPIYHAGSPGPIIYRLNLNYFAGHDEVRPLAAYVNDQPFSLSPVDAWEDKKHISIDSQYTDRGFEIMTDVFVKDSKSRIVFERHSANLTGDELAQKAGLLALTKICCTRLVIRSTLLRKALGLLIRYYPGHLWLSDPSVIATIFEPYSVLLHHYQEIEGFVSHGSYNVPDPDNDDAATRIDREGTVRDMALLLGFLKPIFESTVQPAAKLLSQDVPMISFDMLWYIFRPGTDVWSRNSTEATMAVVHKTEYEQDHEQRKWSSTESSRFILHLWCLNTDGHRVARTSMLHVFERYASQVEVTSLAVCPVSYWDVTDQGARRQSTLAKSRLLVEAIREGSLHIHYDEPNNPNGVVS